MNPEPDALAFLVFVGRACRVLPDVAATLQGEFPQRSATRAPISTAFKTYAKLIRRRS